jgi:hypothetical protein
MDSTVAPRAASPIIVPGQLTLRTIRGRNGPFTVGRLTTHLGVFEVKDAELEQYPEGKYDGEFVIRYIYPKAYPTGGGMRFEIRANLDGMTLSGLDKLSRYETRGFASRTSIRSMKRPLAVGAGSPSSWTAASTCPSPIPSRSRLGWTCWSSRRSCSFSRATTCTRCNRPRGAHGVSVKSSRSR